MSLYFGVLALCLLSAVLSFLIRKLDRPLYYITFIILVLFACLRYGQGVDYHMYQDIYYTAPTSFQAQDVAYFYGPLVKSEFLWKVLMHFFRLLGLPFTGVVMILSVVMLLLLDRFIRYFCPLKCVALLLGFHSLYLTYFLSAMRQGLLIAVFLGIMLRLLLHGKYVSYTVIAILLTGIHSMGPFLLIPLCIKFLTVKYCQVIVFFCCIIGIVINTEIGQWLLSSISARFDAYADGGFRWFSSLERIVALFIMVILYAHYIRKCKFHMENPKSHIVLFYKIYLISMAMYFMLFFASSMASRLVFPFRMVEISLLSVFIVELDDFGGLLLLYVCALSGIQVISNIDSYIIDGNYNYNITTKTFPYISIFNKERALHLIDLPRRYISNFHSFIAR